MRFITHQLFSADSVTSVPVSVLSSQLVFKLQTKNLVEHFLEACSREERDDWAADITAAVEKLQTGGKVESQEEPAGSELHNFNLR